MISILFTQKNSVYEKLGQDCWGIERNALNWPGGNAIVCHPPCRAWGRFKNLSKPRAGEKELTPWAIEQVRKWGGILEHPGSSTIWNYMKLPTPGNTDQYGGITINVNQSWWGHRAQKNTTLYIIGLTYKELPLVPISFDLVEYMIGKGKKPEIPKREREATPEKFAKWLIHTAELINGQPSYTTLTRKPENYLPNQDFKEII